MQRVSTSQALEGEVRCVMKWGPRLIREDRGRRRVVTNEEVVPNNRSVYVCMFGAGELGICNSSSNK